MNEPIDEDDTEHPQVYYNSYMIDKEILPIVKKLNDHGVMTFKSCQGGFVDDDCFDVNECHSAPFYNATNPKTNKLEVYESPWVLMEQTLYSFNKVIELFDDYIQCILFNDTHGYMNDDDFDNPVNKRKSIFVCFKTTNIGE